MNAQEQLPQQGAQPSRVAFEWFAHAEQGPGREALDTLSIGYTVEAIDGAQVKTDAELVDSLLRAGKHLDQTVVDSEATPLAYVLHGEAAPDDLARALEGAVHDREGLVVDTSFETIEIHPHREAGQGIIVLVTNKTGGFVSALEINRVREALRNAAARPPRR